MKRPSPLATAILGLVPGFGGLAFILAASAVGLDLSAHIPGLTLSVQNGVILGSLASVGVGVWGAFKTPTGGEKS